MVKVIKSWQRNSYIPMTRILIVHYFLFTEEYVHSKHQRKNPTSLHQRECFRSEYQGHGKQLDFAVCIQKEVKEEQKQTGQLLYSKICFQQDTETYMTKGLLTEMQVQIYKVYYEPYIYISQVPIENQVPII